MFEFKLRNTTFRSETLDLGKHFGSTDPITGKTWASFCVERNFDDASIQAGISWAEHLQSVRGSNDKPKRPWESDLFSGVKRPWERKPF